jgi:16S rRNA (cytidine1402-2'-O)-methyltransferase
MSTLYIVATPIGNLGDISSRALDVLKNVDLILCEDTRETQKLLSHYGIKVPTISYHQHSRLEKVENIVQFLKDGKNLALVSDAGTPGISDPGNKLIESLIGAGLQSIAIVPIPGPSALAAAASVSGFPMDRFVFLGFPPVKKKRKKFFKEAASSPHSVIFYESPHRIIKSLKELSEIDESLEIVVCRELTKKFETVYRGKVKNLLEEINPKGEFVVIVKSK